MTFKEVMLYLEERDLHKNLLLWFSKAATSIDGKIVSLHFLKEIYLSAWEKPNFGIKLSEEFALYLKKYNDRYDPIQITKDFRKHNRELWFNGKKSKPIDTVVNIVKLKYVIEKLGADYFTSLGDDDWGKCQEAKRMLLKKKKLLFGHEGVAFCTLYDEKLQEIDEARSICDYIGKPYSANNYYLMISCHQKENFRRPTLIDGGFNLPFCPDCDDNGWGQTRMYSSLEIGASEAIIEESFCECSFKKNLLPSVNELNSYHDVKQEYLNREIESLNSKHPEAHENLKKLWDNIEGWWR
jgi:hypothetical protein